MKVRRSIELLLLGDRRSFNTLVQRATAILRSGHGNLLERCWQPVVPFYNHTTPARRASTRLSTRQAERLRHMATRGFNDVLAASTIFLLCLREFTIHCLLQRTSGSLEADLPGITLVRGVSSWFFNCEGLGDAGNACPEPDAARRARVARGRGCPKKPPRGARFDAAAMREDSGEKTGSLTSKTFVTGKA